LLSRALANPKETIRQLDRLDASQSLEKFVVQGWSVLEPGVTLKLGWSLGCVCEHLEAVTAGHVDRLLMNVPPGFMKSLLTNVFWPMWEWGPKGLARHRFVSFSYSASLTERDNDRCRNLIRSQWYQERWGERFLLTKDNTIKIENSKRGWKLATSVGGVGTGERGNRVLVDDPHNVKESESETIRTSTTNWFREVLPSRLNDPDKDAIIVIMQRVHHKDVSGVILAKDHGYTNLMLPMEFEPERRSYTVVKPRAMPNAVPQAMRYVSPRQRWYLDGSNTVDVRDQEFYDAASVQHVYAQDPRLQEGELAWPERFTPRVVVRDKSIMGEFAWAGQMQQRPEPREGAMFKRHWFEIVTAIPNNAKWCSGWDLAGTGEKEGGEPAWTARVKVAKADNVFYIAHSYRLRGTAGEVEQALKATSSQDRASSPGLLVSIPQDPGQAGKGQARHLVGSLAGFVVRASPESGDKVTRAEAAASQAEIGNVKVLQGDWNEMFLDELCSFPFGSFKDQVDAFTRAFNELNAAPPRPMIRRL